MAVRVAVQPGAEGLWRVRRGRPLARSRRIGVGGFPHPGVEDREPVPSARSWVVVMTPAVVEGGGDHAKGVREAHSGHSAPDATVDPWLTWRRRGRLRRRPRSGRRCSGPSPRDGRNNAGPGASASATARAAAVKARASSSRRSTSVCADQAGSTETMCSSRPSGQRRLPVSRRSTTPSRHRAAGRTATTGARCQARSLGRVA